MKTPTIRVNRDTHELLRELSADLGKSMVEIVQEAVEEYHRKRFWAAYHAAYAAIRTDPGAWAEFQDELKAWDGTLSDGLEPFDGI